MNSPWTVLLYWVSREAYLVKRISYFVFRFSLGASRFTKLLGFPKPIYRLWEPLLLSVLLSGCVIYEPAVPMADYYYLNPDKDLSAVGRVAIVELYNNSSYPQISADITMSLFLALQKKQIFGLTVVQRSDSAWRSLQLDSDSGSQTQNGGFGAPSTYSLEQLSAIRRRLKCDAVLVGTVTEFQPYPHMTVGLRLKLVDLSDGQLLWELEQVWDSADKITEYWIKSYLRSQMRLDSVSLSEELVNISSIEFIKFVVYEVAGTL